MWRRLSCDTLAVCPESAAPEARSFDLKLSRAPARRSGAPLAAPVSPQPCCAAPRLHLLTPRIRSGVRHNFCALVRLGFFTAPRRTFAHHSQSVRSHKVYKKKRFPSYFKCSLLSFRAVFLGQCSICCVPKVSSPPGRSFRPPVAVPGRRALLVGVDAQVRRVAGRHASTAGE